MIKINKTIETYQIVWSKEGMARAAKLMTT